MFETIFQSALYVLLVGSSITFGFFLTSVFINHVNQESNIEEVELLNLDSFIEELENQPMSQLSEIELKNLNQSNVILSLEPLLKQTVRMYYEKEEDAFCYYSERESIYKYLDIVARYYCIRFECKQIYVELGESDEKFVEEKVEVTGPFVSKKTDKKKVYEKKIIRFVYKGNEMDYQSKLQKVSTSKDVNIIDFLKLQKKDDSEEYENISKED